MPLAQGVDDEVAVFYLIRWLEKMNSKFSGALRPKLDIVCVVPECPMRLLKMVPSIQTRIMIGGVDANGFDLPEQLENQDGVVREVDGRIIVLQLAAVSSVWFERLDQYIKRLAPKDLSGGVSFVHILQGAIGGPNAKGLARDSVEKWQDRSHQSMVAMLSEIDDVPKFTYKSIKERVCTGNPPCERGCDPVSLDHPCELGRAIVLHTFQRIIGRAPAFEDGVDWTMLVEDDKKTVGGGTAGKAGGNFKCVKRLYVALKGDAAWKEEVEARAPRTPPHLIHLLIHPLRWAACTCGCRQSTRR